MLVHPSLLHLLSQQQWLGGVESTGEVHKHDPQSAHGGDTAQWRRVDNGIIHPDTSTKGALKWDQRRAHQCAEAKDDPLHGLHETRVLGDRPVMAQFTRIGDEGGC